MHTVISDNYSGGSVRSLITGKTYSWTRDNTGTNKRTALGEMESANREAMAAAEARVGRKMTIREHMNGVVVPDTRTQRERNLQDAQVTTNQGPSPDHNPHAGRINELRNQLARTTDRVKRNQIEARLRLADESAQKFDTQRAAEVARETLMSSSEVTTAVVYGSAWLARLQNKTDIPQSWFEGARSRLEALKASGDYAKFWAENDAFEAERKSTLEQRTQALDAEAKAVRAEASAVRREGKADVQAVAALAQGGIDGTTTAMS